MMRKSTLFVAVLLLANGCIKPDSFGPDGTYTAEATASATSASLKHADVDQTNRQLEWQQDDALDLYYAATKTWTAYRLASLAADPSIADFKATQEWEYSRRSHIFYAVAPSQKLEDAAENDPSALPMSLAQTQSYTAGCEAYMVSSGLAIVKGGQETDPITLSLTPALSMLDLQLSPLSDMTLKTLTLTTVGAGTGKGITGAYKMDAATTTVNMRETTGNSITLDFGEEGLIMEKGKTYQAEAVVLPAKLNGLNFSVSGSTTKTSLELAVCEGLDIKQGTIHKLALSLAPGPIRQDYSFEVTCGAIGEEANNKQLIYLGAKKTQTTAIKGIQIAESMVDLEYENGTQKQQAVFWEATCPDWIQLSQTSGTGAATIDVTVLPNLDALTAGKKEGITDLSADGTANTYLVYAPGSYKFNAGVMGNGDQGVIDGGDFLDYSGTTVTSAALSGGTSAKVVWQECANQITDVTLNGSTIEFTTGDYVVPGNAVIALYNGAGQVIWSWQIWFTNELGTDDVITNANTNETGVAQGLNLFTFMNRNLGAMCRLDAEAAKFPKKRTGKITIIQYTDDSKTIPTGKSFTTTVYQHGVGSNSYYKALCFSGMKYQWGRKDPFVIPYTSGNWPAFVRFDGENNELEKITLANGGLGKGYGVTVAQGILNPGTYYKPNSTVNWLDAHNFYLWGMFNGHVVDATTGAKPFGVKTIYDPCPIGYMVPTIDAFSAFSTSYVVGSFSGGYYFKANGSDAAGVFFPAAGEVNSGGSANGSGSEGYYYTGSIASGSNNSYQLYLKNGTVNNNNNTGHGNGRIVRCMKQR